MASGSEVGWTIPEMDDYESLISMTDVEHLKRVWRREKAEPEIFQFESALIGRIKEQIQLMAGSSFEISVCFLGKSREETVEEFVEGRISLQKIEKYMLHILKRDELFNLLSKEEKLFAERCCDDSRMHLEDSVL